MANVIHNRIWTRVGQEIGDVDGVVLRDVEPHHEVHVHRAFKILLKRHSAKGAIRSYRTQAAFDFVSQADCRADLMHGLHVVNLVAGYVWQGDTRTIGQPVLSLPNGSWDEPEWVLALPEEGHDGTGTVAPLAPTGDGPTMPTIEAPGLERTDREGTQNE